MLGSQHWTQQLPNLLHLWVSSPGKPPTPSPQPSSQRALSWISPSLTICALGVPEQVLRSSWASVPGTYSYSSSLLPWCKCPSPTPAGSANTQLQFYSLQSILHIEARDSFPTSLSPQPPDSPWGEEWLLSALGTSPNSFKWPNFWPRLISHHSLP